MEMLETKVTFCARRALHVAYSFKYDFVSEVSFNKGELYYYYLPNGHVEPDNTISNLICTKFKKMRKESQHTKIKMLK